jgi:alkyl sulfatase BDS1-like metallo-beta-lactamase superfamily hydrolase
MQGLAPVVLIPGHGPAVFGRERAARILNDGAEVLESLVTQTLDLVNNGASLDEILHKVSAPQRLLAKPYLLPKYDDPEFVIRNIWHLYAGWFDGNPAHLKPAPSVDLAREIAALAGSAERLAARATALADAGQTRLAAHLIELASTALPASSEIQVARAKVYAQCTDAETSLIGKAIFAVYERDAKARSSM